MRAEARFRPCSSPKAMSQGECPLRLRLEFGRGLDPSKKMPSVVTAPHHRGIIKKEMPPFQKLKGGVSGLAPARDSPHQSWLIGILAPISAAASQATLFIGSASSMAADTFSRAASSVSADFAKCN